MIRNKKKPASFEADVADIEFHTEVAARVIGLLVKQTGLSVTLRYADGGRGEFHAEEDLLDRLAKAINRDVYAAVTYSITARGQLDGDLLRFSLRTTDDLFDAIDAASDELTSAGAEVDFESWMVKSDSR